MLKQQFDRFCEFVCGRRLFTRGLIVQFILLLSFGFAIWYKVQVQNSAYGPRMVFVASGAFPALQKSNVGGYRVTLDFYGNPSTSHPGFLLPKNNSNITAFESDSLGSLIQAEAFSVQEIAKLEFKKLSKDGASALWAIQRVNPISLIPYTRLYVIKTSEFDLWWQPEDSGEFVRVDKSEKLEVRMQDEINLNGIEITNDAHSQTLWLLGYDGILYKYPLDMNEDKDIIFKKGPMTLTAAAPRDLTYVCNLTLLLDASYNSGWQSLDAIEGDIAGAPPGSEMQYFLSTNSIKQEYIVFGIPRKQGAHSIIIWKFSIKSDIGQPRWDEGAIAYRSTRQANTRDAHHIISSEAFRGEIKSGAFMGKAKNTIPVDHQSYLFEFRESEKTDSMYIRDADG